MKLIEQIKRFPKNSRSGAISRGQVRLQTDSLVTKHLVTILHVFPIHKLKLAIQTHGFSSHRHIFHMPRGETGRRHTGNVER